MVLNVYFKLLDATTIPILMELRRHRYKSINYWINPAYTSHFFIKDLKNIQHERIDHQLMCFEWNIDSMVTSPQNDGLEHLVSRFLTEGTRFVIVDNYQHVGKQSVLFQDASHLDDFPKGFVRIPCFCTFQDIFDYAVSENIFSFSLENNADYEKTKLNVQGKAVYKEKKKNRYWYLDNLHKNHYEVFDNTGIHLGEANLEGELDTSKKDKNKTITL